MICARCDNPIREGEQYVTRDIESASGPGAVIRVHVSCRPDAATHPRKYPTGPGADDPWHF
jgi:hypothetical protein